VCEIREGERWDRVAGMRNTDRNDTRGGETNGAYGRETSETRGGEGNKARERRTKRARNGGGRRRREYVDTKGKTRRAYEAYLDLIETAAWMRDLAAAHVAAFRMTLREYHVMARILRNGPVYPARLGYRMGCTRQNVTRMIEKLERQGWVKRVEGRLARRHRVEIDWMAVDLRDRQAAAAAGVMAAKRALRRTAAEKARTGKRVVRVFLTSQGREAIEDAVRKHEKYIKAEMRALDGREQVALSRMCRKLQEGDALRFVRELQRNDWQEDEVRKSIARDIAYMTEQLRRVMEAKQQAKW
jgi:DNA-binding MarR family transcriptional regulator